jgi:hypothetical protein
MQTIGRLSRRFRVRLLRSQYRYRWTYAQASISIYADMIGMKTAVSFSPFMHLGHSRSNLKSDTQTCLGRQPLTQRFEIFRKGSLNHCVRFLLLGTRCDCHKRTPTRKTGHTLNEGFIADVHIRGALFVFSTPVLDPLNTGRDLHGKRISGTFTFRHPAPSIRSSSELLDPERKELLTLSV